MEHGFSARAEMTQSAQKNLADEGDEEELAVAFNLEGYGVAGF
jgi:hypothetical protein